MYAIKVGTEVKNNSSVNFDTFDYTLIIMFSITSM